MELKLSDPVGKLPLVGPVQLRRLAKLEIRTVNDLLNHYPLRYEDFTQVKKISGLVLGQTVTVIGNLIKVENIYTRSRKNIIKARLADETGEIDLIWFNQPFLAKTLKPETVLAVSGTIEQSAGKLAFVSPDYEIFHSELSALNFPLSTNIHTGRLVPVYPETAGVSSKWLRSRLGPLLGLKTETRFSPPELKINDYLPAAIRNQEALLDLEKALRQIHFPQSLDESQTARKRLAFDEIFSWQLKSQIVKKERQQKKPVFQLKVNLLQPALNEFLGRLPFELTADQKRVVDEILLDLSKSQPMNRLLQGDVGSGKTVVAVVCAYLTCLSGFQTVYMAPTEILAQQHFQTFKKFLKDTGVNIGLLTSTTRRDTEFKIANLKFQIVVGTHALLYNLQQTNKTGLVIVDEQHKFGVSQRAELLKVTSPLKNQVPHLLTMTATPIPRSLALTIFGELDLSTIIESPRRAKLIKTWYVPKAKRDRAYSWIKKQLQDSSDQAYVICPFVNESLVETLKSVRSAIKEWERLVKIFAPLRVGLVHGQLKSREKEAQMAKFSQGAFDILVSTPVVEVGIDNPKATIILIEAGERFGLSSLHQLRGRVGRGEKPSYCLIFSETETPATLSRLKLLEKCHSGLELAEMDLKLRGMGSLLGTSQSGFIKTKLADPTDSPAALKVKTVVEKLLDEPLSRLEPAFREKVVEAKRLVYPD